MRRSALICGLLLTLTAGVWGSALAAASEWCRHAASAPAAADDGHDCCRAGIGDTDAAHPASHDTTAQTPHDASHDTAHDESNTAGQATDAHAKMNCASASDFSTPEIRAVAAGGLSCAECCAGNSGQTPATQLVVAPEQNKVKRAAESDRACACGFHASAPSRVSHLAPTQHAPPVSAERRHILISVFLI